MPYSIIGFMIVVLKAIVYNCATIAFGEYHTNIMESNLSIKPNFPNVCDSLTYIHIYKIQFNCMIGLLFSASSLRATIDYIVELFIIMLIITHGLSVC